MKKLAILSAVAALAAFGWAGDADANNLGNPGVSCTVVNADVGFASDNVVVDWTHLTAPLADSYAVSVVCSDMNTGRSKSAKKEVTEGVACPGSPCQTVIPLTDFNGFQSMRAEDVCMATVKGLHDLGPNKNVVGKAACANELVD